MRTLANPSIPMSFPKKLIIAPAAQRDLRGIFAYSVRTWGMGQAERYFGRIQKSLKLVAENPELGSERPDIRRPRRAFIVGSHIIIYRIKNDDLEVSRILHQRMNRADHL